MTYMNNDWSNKILFIFEENIFYLNDDKNKIVNCDYI